MGKLRDGIMETDALSIEWRITAALPWWPRLKSNLVADPLQAFVADAECCMLIKTLVNMFKTKKMRTRTCKYKFMFISIGFQGC